MNTTLVKTTKLCHQYQTRTTLQNIDLDIPANILFAILGPNGSGKTTFFKILSTLLMPKSGEVEISGYLLHKDAHKIREQLGIVFQSPALDDKLTVYENLVHHGHIYGLSGKLLRERISRYLTTFVIEDRRNELVGKLSGGLKRRVELARSLLHNPKILLLDEPTTGLDPNIRKDFWNFIYQVNKEDNVSIIFTTHLFEEAEQCQQIAIFNEGNLVSCGDPKVLQRELGGNILIIQPQDENLENKIKAKYSQLAIQKIGTKLRIEKTEETSLFTELVNDFGDSIDSITLTKPSLEDVFIHKTGKEFVKAVS